MANSTAATMVRELEAFLATNIGVTSINVDGTQVVFDRAKAMEELQYWKREAAKACGRKPRISSINLGSAW